MKTVLVSINEAVEFAELIYRKRNMPLTANFLVGRFGLVVNWSQLGLLIYSGHAMTNEFNKIFELCAETRMTYPIILNNFQETIVTEKIHLLHINLRGRHTYILEAKHCFLLIFRTVTLLCLVCLYLHFFEFESR
ncbi:hypothetical protein GWI33_016216 [Rhynchophorus ferrugineus]|uniref:Uncharacterized protein n=1 Tax=Rhynchophorus ferrugineus TaxID=354439 RepID=A0A834MAK3_RHYFE|nr:hypothetical protein GWI33_016216 [Rhynchophorus ferrugineus]